jgi:threonyl-tRNA synthetase
VRAVSPDDVQNPVHLVRQLLGRAEDVGVVLRESAHPQHAVQPVQASVIPVREEHEPAARALADALRGAGLRPELVRADGTLGARVRHAETMKVPYIAVLGAREADAGTVSVRRRGAGGHAASEAQAEFIARLRAEAESRAGWG